MADANGPAVSRVSWLDRLERAPEAFDFHAALRRFEATFAEQPRLGAARTPLSEPVRIGQLPAVHFCGDALNAFERRNGSPGRMYVNFFGLWGPQGPMPIHLTEYAADRARQAGDHALSRFADLFHHRLLLAFHRAWAAANPAACADRPEDDRFAVYVAACLGGAPVERSGEDGGVVERDRLYYAGQLGRASRSAEGLGAVLADYFQIPVAIEEFVGEWVTLEARDQWSLAGARRTGGLGRGAVLGKTVWSRAHRFRVVLGPLAPEQAEKWTPDGGNVRRLAALVRLYIHDQWDWDVRVRINADRTSGLRLRAGARLGWNTRVGSGGGFDLVIDPGRNTTTRVPSRARGEQRGA